jgi:hypothetical protein
VQNKRVASVRAARRKLVKLFKKPKAKFFSYDFTVRGRRYRASTQETKSVRALKAASLKLASVMENTDPLPSKPTALGEFAERFLAWADTARLEEMTMKVLQEWLAAAEGDTYCEGASESDHKRLRRAIEIPRLGRECQLRFADTATDAPQSGGVEGDRPCSKNQNDEGAKGLSARQSRFQKQIAAHDLRSDLGRRRAYQMFTSAAVPR